jgi:hypothetical protein
MKKVFVAAAFLIGALSFFMAQADPCNNCPGGCLCQNGHCPTRFYDRSVYDCNDNSGCCTSAGGGNHQ